VLAGGDPEQLGWLAGNEPFLETRPVLRERLAATGCADVAQVALGLRHRKTRWPLRDCRTVMAAAREGAGDWTGQAGVLADLRRIPTVERLRASVTCPFPGIARAALDSLGGRLTRAEQLRVLLTIYEHDGGPAALEPLSGAPGLCPEAAAAVREVLAAGDVACLREAVQLAEGTHGLIDELRDTDLRDRGEHLALRDHMDWNAIAAAATDAPFDETATALLTARPDFPCELRDAWYQVHGVTVVTHAVRLDPGMLDLVPGGRGAAKAVGALVRRGLGEGFTATQVLESARPAAAVLEAVRLPSDDLTATAWDDLESLLPGLVRRYLGDDVEAWRTVRAKLSRASGTITELLAEASAAAGGRGGNGWPGAGGIPAAERPASVSGARAAFLTLLDAASATTHAILLPHLDDRTVADLFGHGRWRPEWVGLASASDSRYLRALLRRGSLTADAIELLMRLDEPAVNARIFFKSGATGPQRERLLAGRPARPGATEPVPLDPDLVKQLMNRTAGWRAGDAVDCADLTLQRHILSHVRVRGIGPQLRMLLNLWERHGAEEVAAFLDDEPTAVSHTRKVIRREVRTIIVKLLAREDRDAALAELRARVADGETARWQIAALREQYNPLAELFREAHPWRWAELLAEHARAPLPAAAVKGLANIPECPGDFRAEAAFISKEDLEEKVPGHEATGTTPQEYLRARELSAGVVTWIGQVVRAGLLTWDEVLEHACPAHEVLGRISGAPVRTALARLVRVHLDPSPETWVLALRMLPDFTGSVAELVRTAAAATGVTPRSDTKAGGG
jgi:hypothetical protein